MSILKKERVNTQTATFSLENAFSRSDVSSISIGNRLLFKFLVSIFSVLLILGCRNTIVAQTEREQPKLIDFGESLRPGYIKPPPVSKESSAKPDEDVIRIDTDLVTSGVLVLDERGFPVDELVRDDFLLAEDGKPQRIETFSRGDSEHVPRSIVLVMDYSLSLRPYIKSSVAAAKVLIDKLGPKDKMAIVTDNVELLAPFTHDKDFLKQKLDLLLEKVADGDLSRSNQYSALLATLNELFDTEDTRPIVIFQTDGDEYVYLKDNFQHLPPQLINYYTNKIVIKRNFGYPDVVTALEKARATIYGIIPGIKFLGLSPEQQLEQGRKYYVDQIATNNSPIQLSNKPRSKAQVERIAKYNALIFPILHQSVVSIARTSGGWSEYLETPDKAGDIYAKILEDINQRYLLGYYPTNQAHDGSRRTVRIEVKNHPEYQVITRRSYYALPTTP